MAEHDLWNEDDFFEKLKKEKRAAEKPQSPEPEKEQEKAPEMPPSPLDEEPETLESDLFEQEKPAEQELPPEPEDDIFFGAEEENQPSEPQEIAQEFEEEPAPVSSPPIEAEEGQEEFLESISPQTEENLPEIPAQNPPKKYALSDNYEDEKLAPVNYKPVIIGAIVIILLIVLFFVLRGVIFKGKGEQEAQPAPAQKTEQPKPAEQAASQNPLQAKQNEFFRKIAGANAFSLGLVQNIQNTLSTKNTLLTSLLLYNDEITFEIHCKSRDVLARVTMNLRNTAGMNGLKLISTDEWPDGSISAVFHAKLTPASAAVTPGPKIADVGALQQWMQMLGQQFSVQINSFQELGSSPADLGLSRNRVLLLGQGKYQSVLSFINALAAANRNLKVHKLVLAALGKKNFSKSKYRVELTLDLFK